MRKHIAAAAGAVAALALAVGAAAAPPAHFTDSEDYSGADSCGTFNDMYEGHLDVRGTTTYDKAGNPVRDVVHISGWERNWRSDKPSVSITARRNWTVVYTYATDTEKNAGNIYTQTLPGQGVLFHDVGNITFSGGSVTIHGPHDTFDQGAAAFCNALLAATP
jgi:hypothetical protein